ncbi:helix-hairpin-helix domain-containing protein [Oscillatoria sp. CS-180]|uniref:ComEA family DNA-binding protein n=1 Tax=Oscillatoria sp. CS-180 TaxID=3021720 RepID=UPI00232FF415|nr:helix-hairpin-helix domain-containing protein [Oscillatoria sp. CS-180]MDB9526872.1 helix-hairpin-helix domain-containing protein [Oscillatoria sp. CS-180]
MSKPPILQLSLSRLQLSTWRRRFHPVRDRLRRNPLARLMNIEEVSIAAELGIAIDVNQATVDDWLRLPDVSIHQARTLTALSQSGVAFHCVEDVAAALSVSCDRLYPLAPILAFRYYDPGNAVAPTPVSLNQATVAQLMLIPGMSSTMVERILNERRRVPFTHWQEVQHRLRLTAEQIGEWTHYLRVGG